MRRNRQSQCLFGMILTVLAVTIVVSAQTPSPTPSLEHEFFKNILHDQKVIWTAPLHLQRHDAKWVIPGSVGLMALITTDRITGDEIFESNRQVKASQVISQAGSVYTLGAAAATFYFIGRHKQDPRARETGLLSAEAMLDSLIVGGALKGITQRARPLDGRERSEFFDGGSSFPSGHSTQAWAVATVIANEYQHRRLVQIAAYGMAGAVSVVRFTEHKHYLSDVLAGSALGYGVGKYVYHAHHQQSLDASDDDGPLSQSWVPRFTPQFNPYARAYGVNLRWDF
ncbi:MAG TPA: phosphatase PAP2 family protein [Pyrinomonadaceae bacterium]|nr:phosphatase PAP2 family protein [Pyrinomonadaceae bacterium]